jgi:hypothetical protein
MSGRERESSSESLALKPLGTYVGNCYLQVTPWWGWISHDTTLASNWASSRRRLGPYISWAPPIATPQLLGYGRSTRPNKFSY